MGPFAYHLGGSGKEDILIKVSGDGCVGCGSAGELIQREENGRGKEEVMGLWRRGWAN